MGNVLAGLIGAVAGGAVALFANLVVLPYVLRKQAEAYSTGRRVPFQPSSPIRRAKLTTFAYRVTMPITFAIVGAIAAITQFGEPR